MSLELGKLTKNIAGTFLRQFGGSVFNLLTVIIIARFFGPEGNGVYSIGLLFPLMLSAFLNLGLGSSSVYYVNSGQMSLQEAWHDNLKIFSVLVIVGIFAGAGILWGLREPLFGDVPLEVLLVGLFIFPFSLLQLVISGIFQAAQDFKSLNAVLLIQPILALLVVLGLLTVGSESITSFLIGYLISLVVSILWGYAKLRKTLVNDQSNRSDAPMIRKLLNFGYKTHLGTVIAFLNNRLDLLIVNALIGPAAAGLYVVAVQIVEKVWLVSKSVSTVLLPRLSELSKDEQKRKELTPLVSRWILLVSLILCLGLLACGYYLIIWVFGIAYAASFEPLIYLLPGIIFGAAARVLGNDISARGRPEINFYLSLLALVLNVVLNLTLIPLFGLAGAAVATSLTYILSFILRLIVFKRFTGVPMHLSIVPNGADMILLRGFVKKRKARKGQR